MTVEAPLTPPPPPRPTCHANHSTPLHHALNLTCPPPVFTWVLYIAVLHGVSSCFVPYHCWHRHICVNMKTESWARPDKLLGYWYCIIIMKDSSSLLSSSFPNKKNKQTKTKKQKQNKKWGKGEGWLIFVMLVIDIVFLSHPPPNPPPAG